jgi:ABC-type nitrate/sulfonate/bicarbonate transport system substrate-binding protein
MKNVKYFFLTVIGTAILLQGCNSCNNKQKQDELTLADASVVWWMAPGIIAQTDSLYSKNGLTIKAFDVQTGLASKNAVLSGSADIGLVATTPLALGAYNNDNLIVLCSYLQSNELISVVTTDDKDTSTYAKPHTPVAVVKGTISELYLYNYLKNYYPNDMAAIMKNQLNVKPPDIPNTIKRNAKSACIWEPFASIMKEEDNTLKINRSPNVYNHRIYIVTTPKVLQEKRNAINKFVKSFEMACESIKVDKTKTQESLLAKFPGQKASMLLLWDKVDFSMQYDYDNMKGLMLKDAEAMADLQQTPPDGKGGFMRLQKSSFDKYFNHNFTKPK